MPSFGDATSQLQQACKVVTVNYQAVLTDDVLVADVATAGAALTIKLPDVTLANGRAYSVILPNTGTRFVANIQTATGAAIRTLGLAGSAATYKSNGTSWYQPSAIIPGSRHLIAAQITDPAANTAASVANSVVYFGSYGSFPANSVATGQTFSLEGGGLFSVPTGSTATVNPQIFLGTAPNTSGGITVLQPRAPIGSLAGAANNAWSFKAQLTARASGAVVGRGQFSFEAVGATATALLFELPVVTTTIDWTQEQFMYLGYAATAAGVSVKISEFEIQVCKPAAESF